MNAILFFLFFWWPPRGTSIFLRPEGSPRIKLLKNVMSVRILRTHVGACLYLFSSFNERNYPLKKEAVAAGQRNDYVDISTLHRALFAQRFAMGDHRVVCQL